MKTIEECRENIQKFANDHKIIFEDEGEVGLCRPCVGLMYGESYIEYNPYDKDTYEPISEYYDNRLKKIIPEDAYHKYECVTVLVHGDDYDTAIRQLSDWVDGLRKLKVSLEYFPSGYGSDNPIALMLHGAFKYCFKVNKKK